MSSVYLLSFFLFSIFYHTNLLSKNSNYTTDSEERSGK